MSDDAGERRVNEPADRRSLGACAIRRNGQREVDRVRIDEQAVLGFLVRFAATMTPTLATREVLDHLVAGLLELLPMAGVGVRLGGEDRAIVTGMSVADPAISLRLRHDGDHVGMLDLYGTAALGLDEAERGHLHTIADVAASYLSLARHREDAGRRITVWQDAALHDPLTGLPNRRLLADRLGQAVERSRRSGRDVAILFCDLDGFKRVNDDHGHRAGDELLVAVAGRLRTVLRTQDTLARVSGDEFVILCEHLLGADRADRIARRTLAVFDAPFRIAQASAPVEIGMSVGVALAGDDTLASAMARADAAMYRAKRQGGRCHANDVEPGALPLRSVG